MACVVECACARRRSHACRAVARMNRTEKARKKPTRRQNASLIPVSKVSGPAAPLALSPAPAPPLPPPTPEPEIVMPKPRRTSVISAREAEYMRTMREQTKAQLESITGRMFQVLNDYEVSTANETSNIKVKMTSVFKSDAYNIKL